VENVCVALDAMGGDFGPSVIVPAALDMLAANAKLQLILVGKRDLLEQYLRSNDGMNHPRLKIHEAAEVVDMDEPPALALRNKRESSMRLAINLVKEGEAHACVSAGNTGALMAIARFVLKMLPGVDRPAIVYSLPTMKGHAHVLDLGANINCEAEHLFEFAVMGSVLATAVDNNPHPRVGLLNVGSESMKGNGQVKRASQLLSSLDKNSINYIGFVEGDDIYKGTADVVVCDGFVGNVALKASEGLLKMVFTLIKQEFNRTWYNRLSALVALPVLRMLSKRFDPNQYNGASLLGLGGIVIKSHGRADRKAFAMAIQVAMLEAEKNVPEKIREQVVVQLGKCKKV
jgi:glycerol-3-phosphate acyltransferase PlsX